MKNVTRARTLITLFVLAMALAGTPSCEESEGMEVRTDAVPDQRQSPAAARVGQVNFDGTEGGPLDLAVAKAWVANYRSKFSDPEEVVAHYFGNVIIKDILSQPGCVGIRIYYALDEAGEKKLILVGVDASGENMLPSANGRTTDEGNTVGDFSFPCPNTCPENDL